LEVTQDVARRGKLMLRARRSVGQIHIKLLGMLANQIELDIGWTTRLWYLTG
jgi:hypothetical protein